MNSNVDNSSSAIEEEVLIENDYDSDETKNETHYEHQQPSMLENETQSTQTRNQRLK